MSVFSIWLAPNTIRWPTFTSMNLVGARLLSVVVILFPLWIRYPPDPMVLPFLLLRRFSFALGCFGGCSWSSRHLCWWDIFGRSLWCSRFRFLRWWDLVGQCLWSSWLLRLWNLLVAPTRIDGSWSLLQSLLGSDKFGRLFHGWILKVVDEWPFNYVWGILGLNILVFSPDQKHRMIRSRQFRWIWKQCSWKRIEVYSIEVLKKRKYRSQVRYSWCNDSGGFGS